MGPGFDKDSLDFEYCWPGFVDTGVREMTDSYSGMWEWGERNERQKVKVKGRALDIAPQVDTATAEALR